MARYRVRVAVTGHVVMGDTVEAVDAAEARSKAIEMFWRPVDGIASEAPALAAGIRATQDSARQWGLSVTVARA